jgi:hypothetical protein
LSAVQALVNHGVIIHNSIGRVKRGSYSSRRAGAGQGPLCTATAGQGRRVSPEVQRRGAGIPRPGRLRHG